MLVLTSVPYLNLLAFSHLTKTVPYERGARRPDGRQDHGFRNLKGHPDRLAMLPELASDPALRGLLAAIDAPGTGVFSTACMSETLADSQGCRLSGYFEFALNSRREAADPSAYFRVFAGFDRRLRERAFAEPVIFQWEIGPIRFLDAGVDGFAADVRIDTDYRHTPEAAYECWARALGALEDSLVALPALPDPICRTA